MNSPILHHKNFRKSKTLRKIDFLKEMNQVYEKLLQVFPSVFFYFYLLKQQNYLLK